jgi:UDP-glucose 4-epimerase
LRISATLNEGRANRGPHGTLVRMPILVTGAAGFIGSHVCDLLLAEGHRVIGVDDLSTGRIWNLDRATEHPEFSFVWTDVRQPGLGALFSEHQPEVVMHLAAQSGVRPSLANPQFDASVNVGGLLNVLECSAAVGTRKVVFASSGGTIYGTPRRLPVREDARRRSRPLSPYGISKRMAEDYLRYFRRSKGLDYTALALGNVYGPRQDPHGEAGVISIFGARLLEGEPPTIFGAGGQTRDYVYVEDVAKAFLASMDAGSGELINIGSGRETTVMQLYETIARLTGFTGRPVYAPLPIGEVVRISLDVGLARKALGWAPATALDEGLWRTTAFLRTEEVPVRTRA